MIAWLLAWVSLAFAAAPIHELELRGGVDPGSADYLLTAFERAQAEGAGAVLLRLDTPGGLVSSTREIVQAQLTSEVPILVWVEPAGARAGSAGVFLTAAAHVAAMAPSTTIGAAHPVSLFGGRGGGEESKESEVVEQKMMEDMLAWVRAIAEKRGRNSEWLEAAVRDSTAATAREALEAGVIDHIAASVDELLEAVDGQVVQTAAGPVTLRTAGAPRIPIAMTPRQQVVHLLSSPNVLFALLGLGLLGLYIEFHQPGLLIPGALGVVALLGAAVGLSMLPFNAAGLLLIVVGFVLFALEAHASTMGALAVAGAGALTLGGLLLFDVASFDLSIDGSVLATVVAVVAALAVGLAWLVLRDRRDPIATGAEALAGARGTVHVGGEGQGWVRVEGEEWRATWDGALAPGTPVRIHTVDGLTLRVAPLSEPPEPRS